MLHSISFPTSLSICPLWGPITVYYILSRSYIPIQLHPHPFFFFFQRDNEEPTLHAQLEDQSSGCQLLQSASFLRDWVTVSPVTRLGQSEQRTELLLKRKKIVKHQSKMLPILSWTGLVPLRTAGNHRVTIGTAQHIRI